MLVASLCNFLFQKEKVKGNISVTQVSATSLEGRDKEEAFGKRKISPVDKIVYL